MRNFKISFADETFPFYYATSTRDVERLLPALMRHEGLVGIDIETMTLPEYRLVPKGALKPELSCVRLLQVFTGRSVIVFDALKIGLTELAEMLRPFLQTKQLVAHYAVFELSFLTREPWNLVNPNVGCTQILAKVIGHAVTPHTFSATLKALSYSLLKIDVGKEVQASDWSVPELTFEQLHYAALDAILAHKIAEILAPRLRELKLSNTYKLVKRAQHPIVKMQLNGMAINIDRQIELIDKWKWELRDAKKTVMQLTGLKDLTNPQMAKWLEQNLDKETLAVWPRTDSGRMKTDSHVFADFSYLEIVEPFEHFQRLDKLTSTYGFTLLGLKSPADQMLHTRFNLTGAATGRLSSSEPNFQNMPRYDDKNPELQLRQNFIPEPGMVFLDADYSQIELRVAAEVSQDPTMLEAYRKDIDLHELTASMILKKPLQQVSKAERQMAKAVNFGLLFGLGAAKFSHYARKSYKVEVSEKQSLEAVNTFRKTYAGYHKWQMKQAKDAADSLLVRTPFGKLRKLDPSNTYGTAMNHPVQGGAAEVMLHALCFLHEELPSNWKLTNTVHDEILLSVPDDEGEIKAGKECLNELMTKAFTAVFPKGITRKLVEVGVGNSWAEAK